MWSSQSFLLATQAAVISFFCKQEYKSESAFTLQDNQHFTPLLRLLVIRIYVSLKSSRKLQLEAATAVKKAKWWENFCATDEFKLVFKLHTWYV